MPTTFCRPVYIETDPEAVAGFFHPGRGGGDSGTAVLICPPWGWDEVASYRSRREWAERLAAAGHPTLRFALPATGNSSGSPRDPQRVEAWVGAIVGAAAWLRAESGASRLAVLGLGLGGLLARAALSAGAEVDDLILWAAPASGRAFARETRAFSRMQAWNEVDGEGSSDLLPEGWIEAGGFVLSAETLETLGQISLDLDPERAPQRALLLERDGIAVDAAVREGLEAAGTEVSVAAGDGWAALVSHAERTRLLEATAAMVASWLERAPTPGLAGRSSAPPPAELEELILTVGSEPVRERAFVAEMPFGRAFGVLAEPAGGPASDLCAVCLNAGAVRNIGPNRIWAETARRWAALGVRTLRLDLEGIGEADGAAVPNVGDFYLPKFAAQLGTVLDRLGEQGRGERFLLAGLCAGGYWAFQRALEEPRVEAVVLLNSGALAWDPELVDQREARKLGRVSQGRWWVRLVRGEVGISKLWLLARSLLVAAAGRLRAVLGGGRRSLRAEVYADLDRLGEAGMTLHLGFSAEESLAAELRAYGVLDDLGRWPQLTVTQLPGADHTLRPIAAQAAARELLDAELERARSRS
jgi:dienelactone hydrolase